MTQKIPFTGQVGDSEIRLLRIFVTVVDCGGFSPAEVELNVSRSAISISMGNLEKRLGLRLCNRGRGGFSLTPEGREVYQAALQTLSALDDFRTQVNTLHASLKGDLKIGMTDNLVSSQHMLVTEALRRLKTRGPEVRIHVRMTPPADIERMVLDGTLHAGVVPDLRTLPDLDYHSLYTEESCLYCNSDHPLSAVGQQNLALEELLKWDAVVPAYPQVSEIKAMHRYLNDTATSTDREGIALLVLSGKYIGFLPTHYAYHWERDGKLIALCPDKMKYTTHYSAIVRNPKPANLVLDAFLQELHAA